jgi:putative endonuclease
MQDAADREPGAGGVLECIAVGRPVGHSLQRLVGHHTMYPVFDGFETGRGVVVDEGLTGDNRLGCRGPRRRRVSAGLHRGAMTTLTRAEIGALGEQLAVDHLESLGMRVLVRNWRCRYGELDVIAADDAKRIVVFVEVKTRTSDQFGGVAQAVTPDKVRRLRRLAGVWLAAQNGSWAVVRIDVIGVRIGRRRTPEITHLQGVG